MSELLRQARAFGILLLLLLLVGSIAWYWGSTRERKRLLREFDLLSQETSEFVTEADTERMDLEDLLQTAQEDNLFLKEALSGMKPVEVERIRYVIQTKTVTQGTVLEYQTLPGSHLFYSGTLPVAYFEAQKESYLFQSADLTFNTTVIVGPDKSRVELVAASSLAPQRYFPLKTESLTVYETEDRTIWEPNVAIGASYSVPRMEPALSLMVPFFHPWPEWDMAVPRLSVGEDLYVGLDAASYNVGEPLPVFTDLWISTGASVTPLGASPSLDLTISSKF
jgi:hypothetical protein